MAFFNEIGKKISQTGQMAVQKTKDMADVAKLNSSITEEERKINNVYYQIGQLYVSKYKDDAEEEFSVLIEQLKESEKRIEELKKQIQDIKGVKRCATCGAEISENSTFCSVCGAGVIPERSIDVSNSIKCNTCGKLVEKGMKFCTFCGSPINEMPIIDSSKKICTNCGALIEEDVLFCTNCGAKIEDLELEKEGEVLVKETNTKETTLENKIKTCSSCGTEIEEGSLFCVKCGEKVQLDEIVSNEKTDITIEETPTNRACPNCGFEADEDSLFCVKCGTRID